MMHHHGIKNWPGSCPVFAGTGCCEKIRHGLHRAGEFVCLPLDLFVYTRRNFSGKILKKYYKLAGAPRAYEKVCQVLCIFTGSDKSSGLCPARFAHPWITIASHKVHEEKN
jgi:hypothetical protein